MDLTQIIYNERRETIQCIISCWFLTKLTDAFVTYWKETLHYFIYSVSTDLYFTNKNILYFLKLYSNNYSCVKKIFQHHIDELSESTTIYTMDSNTYNIIHEIIHIFDYNLHDDKITLLNEILIEIATNFIVKTKFLFMSGSL